MKFSEIRDTGPAWQQFVPIQSVSQLLSISAIYALLISIVYLFTRHSTEHEVFATICLGVTVGAFPALIAALPQEFSVEFGSEGAALSALDEIDELLKFRGYRKKDGTSTVPVLYMSKLPAVLSWKENGFSIYHTGKSISIRGPRGSVKWLRDRLVR
jgi:hypothetical protein